MGPMIHTCHNCGKKNLLRGITKKLDSRAAQRQSDATM
jgi:hypothetical protein